MLSLRTLLEIIVLVGFLCRVFFQTVRNREREALQSAKHPKGPNLEKKISQEATRWGAYVSQALGFF